MTDDNLIVGKYTYGKPNIRWALNGCKVIIGNFCSIAGNVNIYLGGNHRYDWVTTYPFGCMHQNIFNKFNGEGNHKTNGDVIIGNDVWIGDNVTIMSGVHIGDGSVIANNSHIVKNCEPYSLIGGNPGKLIKFRFSQEQIQYLLDIKWWNWDDVKINENANLLCNINIDNFIHKHKKSLINVQTYYYNNDNTRPITVRVFDDNCIRVSSSYWKDDFGTFYRETNEIKFNTLGKGKLNNMLIEFENGGIWHKDNKS